MKQSEADKQSESWDRESKTHASILKYKARTCCCTHPFELADDFEVVEWLMFAGTAAVTVVCMMQRTATLQRPRMKEHVQRSRSTVLTSSYGPLLTMNYQTT